MIHTNSHVIATSTAPTWLPFALIGHCVAVFQPCDGLTFYPVQASKPVGKGSMGRFPGEDPVNTQEPGMSESKFRPGSHICLLQALDEVSTPYPLYWFVSLTA